MKVYKTTTVILSIALIGVLVFMGFFNRSKEPSFFDNDGEPFTITQEWVKAVLDYQNLSDVDELQDDWIKKNYIYQDTNGKMVGGIHPRNTGSFIELREAREKYSKFVEINRGMNGEKRIKPYAFAFGIDNLRSLIRAIERENLQYELPKDSLESIRGVRAYLVVTKDKETLKDHYDLMMIPVQGNGFDYRQIDKGQPFLSDSLFLNTSAPCPNNCEPEK